MKLTGIDLMFWYDIYVVQATEEEIANEIAEKAEGKKVRLPSANKMRELVNQRIKERKNKNGA